MFNNSVKHKSEMVGDQSSRQGGQWYHFDSQNLDKKCYFPDRKCLISPCVGES